MQRRHGLGEGPVRRLFVVGAMLATAWGALSLFPAPLSAQATPPDSQPQPRAIRGPSAPWLPRLRLDNDAYNFWIHPGSRTDREYTDGVAFTLESLRAPWWGRRMGGGAPGCAFAASTDGACLSTQYVLAHDMYTPMLTRPPGTYPTWRDDRPYAALLYVGTEGRRISARGLRSYSMQLGVTGPPALGKLAQSIAHTIVRDYTTKAEGWETQVGFEPSLLLGARQSLLAVRWARNGRGILDVVPSAGLTLGNIRTAADAGARVRLGMNLSHPWDPRTWRGRPDWEFHLSAAGQREYVAHDFSLDGTLLKTPNRSVTRVPGVQQYEFGTAVRLHRFTIGYRAITRSREYTTGPSRHVFSQMYSAIEFNP